MASVASRLGLTTQQSTPSSTTVSQRLGLSKPVVKVVTPPTTQPVSFAGKAPVSALFNPVTSPIPPKTVTKPTTGVFPTLQTKLAEKPYVSPYPTEKPATISPAGETILKTVAKTGVSLLEQVTKGLDYTQDLIAKNLISKKQPTLAPVAKLNDKWLNWYTQKESKGELLTQKAQKFVDTLAKSDYVQNRPEWEVLPLKEKLKKENLGETILNLVPSVLSSVALYAINPAVGFVTSASSTAQDVKEDAIKNGVDEKKAEKLALATGLTVGALDKIVPDDVFRNNEIKKLFLKDFMKNLVRRTVTEAGTEIAQEDIQMIAEQTYREISKDEKKTRQVMSMLGGALGGAGFSILGDFANTTVQNDIMQTPPTKKTTIEEIKFTNPKTLAEEIGNSEPGGVKSVDKLSKTLETKDDEIYRDRVEEYKQKIQNGEAIDPIVVNEKEEVLDGGHRLTAMQELGIKATETVVQKEKPVVEKPTKVAKKVETNEALLEEARKYKSAEEFVKAQGTTVYHGTKKGNVFDTFDRSKMGQGVGSNMLDQGDQIYLTESKKAGEWFANPSGKTQGEVIPFTIKKGSKILDVKDMPRGLYGDVESSAILDQAKKDGYDLVRFPDKGFETIEGDPRTVQIFNENGGKAPNTVIVLNDNSIVSNRQLTDIWNKANAGSKIDPLIQEARKYKSAEEFVSSQKSLFHGTNTNNIQSIEKNGLKASKEGVFGEGYYFTPNKSKAEFFAKDSGKNGDIGVVEQYLKPDTKLFDFSNPNSNPELYQKIKKILPNEESRLKSNWGNTSKIPDIVKSYGYDGIDYLGSYRTIYNKDKILTKSQLTDIYNQAKGLTPEVKQKVVEKVEERKIETIAKPIEYIEKQVETTKDIKSVKTTLSSIRNELDNAIAEAEGKSIVATEQRAGLDTKKIGELKRIASLSKEYRAGNWDILKKKHGNLVDYVVVDVQRLHPEMEYDEAIDFALNLPTKAEESARTPIIRELEKKQKKLAKYLELLKKRQDELKVKTDNELDKQWRGILSAQEKLIKVVSVAREQLPLGEGKKKVSRLEARVNKISKKISNLDQETIDRLSLATYNQLNKKENISKAVKYVKQNPEKALKVLTGEIEAPNGILRNAIYVAMQNEAIGDVELARKIASIGATRLGQEISILTEIDPNSPVKVMSDVIKIKEEAFNKRFGKQRKTEVTEKSVNELKKSVKKPDKYDWNSFINSIQC